MELLAPEEDAGADPRPRGRDATADPDGDPSPDPTDAGRRQQPPQAAGAPSGNTSAEDRDLVVPPGPVRARWVADRVIRSSNGVEELRPVIRTTVALGGHRWVCEMTLAERGSMGHPVLLGRTAIRRRFLVHPGRSFLTDTGSIIAGAGGV
ncbi:MAG: ATP-dependent zinc protease [Candidatus Microthrix sp.]|uniref:ATP-dependent zinc protease n=1 Tax=Candidatus Neomicrothrix subdominans TaxID=2954438 RepID=A0A936THN1_9ACTN|nr:ATP-dependent zinc protease [Candidatus Microthrix sp.]MBK6968700.1 ATP-dependent zinc protease [Candidatus Microthrix sp.]MBK7166558.1 ATP-dependent zinc protease [Candidatus Microthrix sp.]MBK9299010.1 ATP-dependent zinc protease [Candidatus Microthrix subdominans]